MTGASRVDHPHLGVPGASLSHFPHAERRIGATDFEKPITIG